MVMIPPWRFRFWPDTVIRLVPSAEARAVTAATDPSTRFVPLKLALATMVVI